MQRYSLEVQETQKYEVPEKQRQIILDNDNKYACDYNFSQLQSPKQHLKTVHSTYIDIYVFCATLKLDRKVNLYRMCNQFINVLSLKVQESKYIESTANVVEKPEFEKTQNMNCQYLMRIMENKQRQIILDSDNKYACDQCNYKYTHLSV